MVNEQLIVWNLSVFKLLILHNYKVKLWNEHSALLEATEAHAAQVSHVQLYQSVTSFTILDSLQDAIRESRYNTDMSNYLALLVRKQTSVRLLNLWGRQFLGSFSVILVPLIIVSEDKIVLHDFLKIKNQTIQNL